MLMLNPLLQDFAVLQAEKNCFISGKTNPLERVSLHLSVHEDSVMSDPSGNFEFKIPPQSYGTICKLYISNDKESIEITVQYGDVFLFAGQSNIEYYMENETHYQEELTLVDSISSIYFYTVPQIEYEEENSLQWNAQWNLLSSNTLKDVSAIAYYVVKEHKRLHPERIIGIVSCSKGGTSASCWISKEYAMSNKCINDEILQPFERAIDGKSRMDFDQELNAYLSISKKYYEKKDRLMKKYPHRLMGEIKREIGNSPWPPPSSPYLFTRPCGLYYTMFRKIVPYTFSSIIWYQGEEDTKYTDVYYDLLKSLMKLWRNDIKENIRFYIVQLPICNDREHHNWSSLRRAQELVVKEDQNAYLITSLDCGEIDDIHPKEKAKLGRRISEIMNNVYYSTSPYASIMSWNQKEVILECSNTKKIKLENLIIEADVEIKEVYAKGNKLYIYSNQCINEISYGYHNAFNVSIYNEVDYPIAPFRFKRPL